MRQVDVLARAFAEAMGKPDKEAELRRELERDAPPFVRAALLAEMADADAQAQLARMREPAIQHYIFNEVISEMMRQNQAKARGRNV